MWTEDAKKPWIQSEWDKVRPKWEEILNDKLGSTAQPPESGKGDQGSSVRGGTSEAGKAIAVTVTGMGDPSNSAPGTGKGSRSRIAPADVNSAAGSSRDAVPVAPGSQGTSGRSQSSGSQAGVAGPARLPVAHAAGPSRPGIKHSVTGSIDSTTAAKDGRSSRGSPPKKKKKKSR